MSFLRPTRRRQEELLDVGAGTKEEIQESLRDLRRINRWLGGHHVSQKALQALIHKFSLKHFSFLDIATGSADLPLAIARWARASRMPCRIVGVDIQGEHLRFGIEEIRPYPEIQLTQVRVEQLPFRAASFDFVNVSLFLHHVEDAQLEKFLQSLISVARIAVIVNDLERHWAPYLFLKLTQPIFARSRLTRFDGFASLRQGFTSNELAHLARAAHLDCFTVRRHFPYRLSLVIEKNSPVNA